MDGFHPASDEFVGRSKEIGLLESAHRSRGSAFIPIYGRRRVGKSELIRRFLRDKTGVYFLGKRAQPAMQIRELLGEAAAALGDPLLASARATGWKDALEAVVSRWPANRRVVIAMDEFQWTAEASPELPSVLQDLWDRQWRQRQDVFLILCGSYVGFMEREVLGRKSPLFGRRTAQIFLRPFGFREAAEFHRSLSVVDRARVYFVCGGIPLYLHFFSASRSVEANIAAAILDELGPLHYEPDFLLREELREVDNYYGVLWAAASGAVTARDIAREANVGDRSLQYYLSQLIELGYLERRYPLTGKPPGIRQVRYDLADPLLRFWFRFVYPNQSFIQHMGARRALSDRVRPMLGSYFGGCFERLCREALPTIYEREGVSVAFEVGEYWDDSAQIDVVGLRSDNWTDLGECKWGRVGSAAAVVRELESKIGRYPNERNATIHRRIFTRAQPRTRPSSDRVSWHGLEDLYGPT